ncbi:MAG: hypothetical protein EXR93_05605 [Gemmatimonadetes bacterium]|nr:hypothetical protein [Gemmatimonadota bacterium]
MTERRYRLLASFLAVYIIWGSTYLAIKFAIETLPPFLMAGARFVVAGAILFLWAWWRGAPRPTRANWIAAAIVGALLLVGGNGGVVWAEQRVATGLTALLVATEPAWVVVFDWLRPGGQRPGWAVVAGLLVGFAGVGLLVSPADFIGGGRVDPLGAFVLVLATVAWAAGSLYTARGAPLPRSPMMATGMQMLAGGTFLLLLGSVHGEWARLDIGAVSLKSWLALLYLLIFGAIVGFTAYVYLLQNTTLARASTYAYVNPGIAVLLGWLFAGETLSPRVLFATFTIITAVALLSRHQPVAAGSQAKAPEPRPEGAFLGGRSGASSA